MGSKGKQSRKRETLSIPDEMGRKKKEEEEECETRKGGWDGGATGSTVGLTVDVDAVESLAWLATGDWQS